MELQSCNPKDHVAGLGDCPDCAAKRFVAYQTGQDVPGLADREIGSEPLQADQPPEREVGS